MTQSTIRVTYTRSFDRKPLVTLDGGPFNGHEFRPEQLRAMAAHLVGIADLAERRPTTGRNWMPAGAEVHL